MNATPLSIPQITLQADDTLTTTSTAVADFFERRHKNITQAIENLGCSTVFASANFSAHVKNVAMPNGATREDKYYEMTAQGFTFLAMGFTGKKAAAFKEAYITRFHSMQDELLQKYKHAALPQTLTPAQQRDVQKAVAELSREDNSYGKHYGNLKDRFQVGTYKDIPSDQFPAVMAFLHGEYIPEEETKALPQEVYNFPAETARPSYKLDDVLNAATLLDERYESPLVNLLNSLHDKGHDVNGAVIELKAMRHTLETNATMFASIQDGITTRQQSGLNFNRMVAVA